MEADAYWPDGLGAWVKMDAFVRLERDKIADYWWYEAYLPRHDSDLVNESLPVIRRKLVTYLDFVQRGQLGPDGVMPRPLIGVPTAKWRQAVQAIINELPAPSDALFVVADMTEAAQVMVEGITEE